MHRFSVRAKRAHLVRWREWGADAFEAAQAQDKPVMLCLTAFWCGFCQRMDETTFSNDDVIALLNAYFVPIRVEEAQRPDIDLRYNKDGWPTIAFLTPKGDHLLSVNHTPPEAFAALLVRLHKLYKQNKDVILTSAAQAREEAAQRRQMSAQRPPLASAVVGQVAGMIEGLADAMHGGYSSGTGNKMLHAEANEFFLYLYETTGEASYLDHVALTLTKMRQSRTYDEKDGGFFRYSSKPDWREPHPEKLLADQPAMLSNYLHAYLVTGREDFRQAAEALVAYIDGTLSDPATGLFYGCQDYVRPEDQGPREGPPGPRPLLSVIDKYIYTDANALAASVYLEASWILGRPECKERALRALEALWGRFRAPDGGFFHCFDGQEMTVPGLLNDSVAVGNALLDVYRFTGQASYLERARVLASETSRDYLNPGGGFFDIEATGPASLQYRMTVLAQNVTAAVFFVRLADLTREKQYRQAAAWALQAFTDSYQAYGAFAAGYGYALARLLAPALVVTVTGDPFSPGARSLARAALTQLRHPDLLLRFEAGPGNVAVYLEDSQGKLGPISDAADLTLEHVFTLRSG